jgi:hypothetical protein
MRAIFLQRAWKFNFFGEIQDSKNDEFELEDV